MDLPEPIQTPVGGRPRVVSLLPSATEALCAIGGSGLLVGRSHECDWPPGIAHLPILTRARADTAATAGEIDAQVRAAAAQGAASLYELDSALLERMAPDVVLTQDLCAVCSIDLAAVRSVASRLARPPTVVSVNPTTIEGVLEDVLTIGGAVGLEGRALDVVTGLRERLYSAADYANPYAQGQSVALLEWTDPLFAAGHWNPQLIERAGGTSPLNPTVPVQGAGGGLGPIGQTLRHAGKSLVVSAAQLVASAPEVVVIAPCGRTLAQATDDARALRQRGIDQGWWSALPAVLAGRVYVVDGNAHFNRPGPRLVDAFCWLVAVINDRPGLLPEGFLWRRLEP